MNRWPAALLVLCAARSAAADEPSSAGFAEMAEQRAPADLVSPRPEVELELHGNLRARGELLYNFDLDRGLTPSGQPLFPLPLGDPTAQSLHHADMRLRTDFAARRSGIAVKLRVDVLDNLALGSTPEGRPPSGRAPTPAASPGQLPPRTDVFQIERAYGEALTPLGLLAIGRMGSHWGLGMLANSGDCADCNSGDAADRIAFVTPLAGHIWAAAYDLAATGPLGRRRDGARSLDLEPTDDVNTITLAVLRYHTPVARERRLRAGRGALEYGAYVSHRWQDSDVPADYLPIASPPALAPEQVMARGYRATALDGWLRVSWPRVRVELEAALIAARVDQASLVPGVFFRDPVESRQIGVALESEAELSAAVAVGIDAGYASGDPAPGFGALPDPKAPAPAAGELDGAQANPPFDNRADNFRFHPDYHIDRILFREIIGTVTDVVYLRPHARAILIDLGRMRLVAELAVVASRAVEAASTPGGAHALGVEIDPTLTYETLDGFSAALEHAVLLPMAGLDNSEQGLPAGAAQLIRLRVGYRF